MKFKNTTLFLALALLSIGLFSSCQKEQLTETSTLSSDNPTTGLQAISSEELKSLGLDVQETISEVELKGDFKLNTNAVGFRNHRPIIDPCTQGSSVFRMDIEDFELGANISTQSPRFEAVHGDNSYDGIVMPEYNNQFVKWKTETFLEGGVNDAHTLLHLDEQTSGRYVLSFNLKVFPEHTAYFDVRRVLTDDIDEDEVAAKFWFISENTGILRVARHYYTFEYPQNTWMNVYLDFDIDNNMMRFYINQDLVSEFPIACYPGAVGQTVQIEAVSYSTEYHQRNTGVSSAAPTFYGGFKTDNHCFSRVN